MRNSGVFVVVSSLFLVAAGLFGASQAAASESGLKFGGSIRARYEHLNYSPNADGTKKDTRSRLRYRLRFDAKAKINPRAGAYFRLVSGTDSRSANTTLGDPDDFGPNAFSIRHAALTYSPWAGGTSPSGATSLTFDFGRVKNPYRWQGHGKDMMLWDGDIALAGTGAQFGHQMNGASHFFVNTGYYIFDENSEGDKDPYMVPLQLGLVFEGEDTSFGLRSTYYHMAELDADFISRGAEGKNTDGSDGATNSGGNIVDGLTGDPNGGDLKAISAQAFVAHNFGRTPIVLSAGYSQNTSAEASQAIPEVAANGIAYNVGLEAGTKRVLLLGAGWFHIEANAFPSQFTDSDLLDGHTNREGLLFYIAKSITTSTAFNLQYYISDAIDSNVDLDESVEDAKRNRLQVDLTYKF